MADETKKAWQDVAENFSALGKHVSRRYREATPGESSAEQADREKVGAAVRSVIDKLNEVFTTLGDSLREPEGKDALEKGVRSVGNALSVTFSEVGEDLRRGLGGSRRGGGSDEPSDGPESGPAGEPTPPPPGAEPGATS